MNAPAVTNHRVPRWQGFDQVTSDFLLCREAPLFLPEWVSLPSIGIIPGAAAGFGVLVEGPWFLAGFWLWLTVQE